MPNYSVPEVVKLEETRFFHQPHWSGTPRPERGQRFFQRSGPIVVNDPAVLAKLHEMGFTVYETKPAPGEEENFHPEYYIYAEMNFVGEGNCRRDPLVYLMSNGRKTLLTKETVGQLDEIPVERVNVVLSLKITDSGARHAYVHVMYCWQGLNNDAVYRAHVYDPWADMYK